MSTVCRASPGIVGGIVNTPNSLCQFYRSITGNLNWTSGVTYIWDTVVQPSPYVTVNTNGTFVLNAVGTYLFNLNLSFSPPGGLGINASLVTSQQGTVCTPINQSTVTGQYSTLAFGFQYPVYNFSPGGTVTCQLQCSNPAATFGVSQGYVQYGTLSSIQYFG